MNNKNNYINRDDGVSLFSLIDILFNRIILVIGASIILSILSFVYVYNQTQAYKVTIPFKEINKSKLTNFIEINNLLNVSGANEVEISSEKIFDIFVATFMNKEEIYDVYYTKFKEKIVDMRNLDLAAKNKANSFQIKVNLNNIYPYKIEFFTPNPSDDLDLLSKSIKKINKQVYNEILLELEAVTNSLQSEHKRRISDLKKDLSKRKNIYLKDISIKIATLKEQAEIARSLNIFENETNMVNKLKSVSGDIISIEKFDYLRGADALENEIETLENRSPDNVIEYDSLYANIQAQIEHASAGLESIVGINNYISKMRLKNDFLPVSINIRQAYFEPSGQPKIITLSILVAISIIFASVLTIFYDNYQSYRKTKK